MSDIPYHKAMPLFAPPTESPEHPLAPKLNRLLNIAPCGLGESPVWDHRTQTLYWIDIVQQTLTAAQLGSATPNAPIPNRGASASGGPAWLASVLPKVTRYTLPTEMIGCVVPTERPDMVALGSNHGIVLFDLRTGKVARRGQNPEFAAARNRFNDGKVGPGGRLYVGSMQMRLHATDRREKGSGRVYQIDSFGDSKPRSVDAIGPTTVSNGMGWTPDERVYFHIDTDTRDIHKYDFDPKTGDISNKRQLRHMGERLDGMCVDSEGCPWVAVLEKGEVHRLDKDTGETRAVVRVPGAKLVTSVCFGGPQLSLMFITTAAGTTPDAVSAVRKANPEENSGQIYVADVGVSGNLMVPFKLQMSHAAHSSGYKSKL